MSAREFFVAFGLLSLLGAACSKSQAPSADAVARVQGDYDKGGRLTRISYDRNGDGKPDSWAYMDGARLLRTEVDEDGDGNVDRWEYHTPEGSESSHGSQGSEGSKDSTNPSMTLTHIERATRHDGRVSRWEHFEGGKLVRVEEDTDGDGKIDKWETYSAGTLMTMATDSEHRGTPDRRLVYRTDGTFDHIETDPSGHGHFTPLTQ